MLNHTYKAPPDKQQSTTQYVTRDYKSPILYSVSNTVPLFLDHACSVGRENVERNTKSNTRYALGAVIYNKKRQIISTGWSQRKTHPIQARFKSREHRIFLHAEIHAIVRAKTDLTGHHIAVGRKHLDGKTYGQSMPCLGCMEAIKHAGLSSVSYYYREQFIIHYL